MTENEISKKVIGAAIEVHKSLGPGLLESAYQMALCREFELSGIAFKKQVVLPVEYKGVKLDPGYRLDILVENKVFLGLKSVEALNDIYKAQLLTYLKLSDRK